MTRLGDALASSSDTPATKAGRFLAALASSRVLEDITIPRLGIPAKMTVPGAEKMLEIEAEVAKVMKRRGLEAGIINHAAWEIERAIRTFAVAVLEDDGVTPLGSVTDWGRASNEVLSELWRMFADVVERHDPASLPLDEETIEELKIAIKKKDAMLLRSYGARRLAAFMITTVAPPASSMTVESSPGDTSPES